MIRLPEKCLRGFDTCQPYSQIASDCGTSFFCCGENDGRGVAIKEDKYTFCFKGAFRDDTNYNDKRDLTHAAAVLLGALAIIEC